MKNKENMEIVNDALECQPLYHQFVELDTEDELHDGTPEGIRNHYDDAGIMNEAYWRADICNANREPDGSWSEYYRDYESDYIQLQRFIKKWINKIDWSAFCGSYLKGLLTKIINDKI